METSPIRLIMAKNSPAPCAIIYLLVILSALSPSGFQITLANQDADYSLDDSYLNNLDRSEVERLLRDYPSNQDLVRSIGAQYYQIVNVVQIRHHQIMGLSTRESTSKGPRSQAQGMQAMQQSRTGKHYHRTSFLIQAFNHKFRLILELNPTLIAPNIHQKHVINENTDQKERSELEMCYYHGIVEGLEWSAAAVRTCNGLSGIIHMGNETFIIHPFYGGDLSHKHPHIVFEAKSIGRQSCGNDRYYHKFPNYNKLQAGYSGGYIDLGSRRSSDEKNGPQYFIELAVLLDKQMFDKRNGSTRLQVIHDALQIVNIADLYFRKLNTAISVVYIETWRTDKVLAVDKPDDLEKTLKQLIDFYVPRSLYSVTKDVTMLVSGVPFSESGIGVENSICTSKSLGIVTDVSVYQPHITGVALAHMIGHTLNMGHDHDADNSNCNCPNWYGCIMSETIVGRDGIQPYRFSECSRRSYFAAFNAGHAICLSNKPSMFEPSIQMTCGNGLLDAGEECDCGSPDECAKDPCCDGIRCRFKTFAECSNGQPCCENCKFKLPSVVCRPKARECDLTEHCTGKSGECPLNYYKKNGTPCAENKGFCYNGVCPTLDQQCRAIWDFTARVANKVCFDSFNVRGMHNGHCGRDAYGSYRNCSASNVMCGLLHCKGGEQNPTASSTLQNTTFSRSLFKMNGTEIECKSLNGQPRDRKADQMELVRDGTKCAESNICLNQTCVKISSLPDKQNCPTNHKVAGGLPCSGHGDCSNINICHCDDGYEGHDCSQAVKTTAPEIELTSTQSPFATNETTTTKQGKIIVPGPDSHGGSNTIFLVFGMVSVVGGVFLLFAMLALCYRRSTVPKYEHNPPQFNPKTFKLTHNPPPVLNHEEIDNRILSFTQLPAFRDQHNLAVTGSMKNLGSGAIPHDEEMGDETENSAFLGTPNSLSGNSKGILKKYIEEDSQSDNNEIVCGLNGDAARAINLVAAKQLNGYHEDILAALRIAANHQQQEEPRQPPVQGSTRLSEGYPDYPDFGSEFPLLRNSTDRINPQGQRDDESNDDMGGPLRIRNLEDLLRQLEHHSSGRHLSPCGSEDIRMSETEADRHYRLHSVDLGGDDDSGFVLGRYRGPGMTTAAMSTAKPKSNHNNNNNNNKLARSRSPMSDYGLRPDPNEDDLDSCFDGTASPYCPCYFCNQPNILNTSTSEEEEDEDEETGTQMSLTPSSRKMQNRYNPQTFGSQSPLHTTNGEMFEQPQTHFPEYEH